MLLNPVSERKRENEEKRKKSCVLAHAVFAPGLAAATVRLRAASGDALAPPAAGAPTLVERVRVCGIRGDKHCETNVNVQGRAGG